MSKRYPGNFVTGNPVALSQASNNGIWDLSDNYTATGNSTWQEPSGIYQIAGSTAFSTASSTYMYKTFASGGNRRTWTWSAWVKRGSVSTTVQMFASRPTSSPYSLIYFASDGTFQMDDNGSCGFSTVGLFRDPSAWYHLIISIDTTRANASERIRVFVNGVQQTCTYTIPTQNAQTQLNTASRHTIGKGGDYTSEIFDGRMSELNFVDGQALDPSYFGYFDPITNIWMPKRYAGSFGVTGFYLPLQGTTYAINAIPSVGNATPAPTAYYLNFNGSSRLNIAHTSALDLSTGDFTIEFWYLHRDGSNIVELFCKGAGYQIYTSGGSINTALSASNTTSYFVNTAFGTLNPGDWNHVALTRVGNNYYGSLNGVTTLLTTSSSGPNSGTDVATIGAYFDGTYVSSGGISNLRVVKATGLYTRNYVVPNYNLSAIPGTQLLTGQSATIVDNSPNALSFTNIGPVTVANNSLIGLVAWDKSGTSGAFTTTGFNINSLIVDSPTNVFTTATDIGGVVPGNYCTWNPIDSATGGTISNGNLNITPGFSTQTLYRGTTDIPSGKWYWEITCTGTGGDASGGEVGVTTTSARALDGAYVTWAVNSVFYAGPTGNKNIFGTSTSYGNSFTNGDVIGVAVDTTADTIQFFKNNTSQGVISSVGFSSKGMIFPVFVNNSTSGSRNISANFGQRPFSYAPPSGYKSLNTTNLQALGTTQAGKAAIQANKWFDISLYGGTSSAVTDITNSGFKPDLVWIKNRRLGAEGSGDNMFFDTARGATAALQANRTDAEAIQTNFLTAFNENGFRPGTSTRTNETTAGYVAWQWKQSPTAGFNIISYTGNGANNRAISHNLGVAPKMIIIKNRDATNGMGWATWHGSEPTKANYLNETGTFQVDSYAAYGFNEPNTSGTVPTSNSFYVSASGRTYNSEITNGNNQKLIAYLWAEVPGFSKFGSYTGNGSTDGPFIYTGFRPKFLLIKSATATGSWLMLDTARNISNIVSVYTTAENPGGEAWGSAFSWLDITANGFKHRNTGSWHNSNGVGYIYAAFAESPFALNNRAR